MARGLDQQSLDRFGSLDDGRYTHDLLVLFQRHANSEMPYLWCTLLWYTYVLYYRSNKYKLSSTQCLLSRITSQTTATLPLTLSSGMDVVVT